MVLGAVNIDIDSKFLRKLVATTANGVGAVAGAWIKRRNAHANADSLRIEAQGQRDAEDILSGKKSLSKDGQLVEVASVLPILIDDTVEHGEIQARLIFQEKKRQNNIRTIFDKASSYSDGEISDVPVNEDWVARYFTYAQDVSSDKMQDIWARILANEVRAPGSCSLRTLEILKVLSAEDAALFEKIRPYIIESFIPSGEEYLSCYKVSFDDIVKLDEAGLINSGFGQAKIFVNREINKGYFAALNFDTTTALIVQHENSAKNLRFRAYSLTKAGVEIDRMLRPANRNIEFLKELINPYKSEGYIFHLAPVEGDQFLINKIKQRL